jgi:hypothetical protein
LILRHTKLVSGLDRATLCDAVLVRGVAGDRLREIERIWRSRRDESLFSGVDDFIWNWENKVEGIESGAMLLSELRCNDMPQGAIAVSTKHRPSRSEEGNQILYVEYLENAPWNIKGNASEASQYLGVGILLIAEAVDISLSRGLNGRIGLHSLPLAEPFYRDKCRFTEFGPDANEDQLVYFEYSERQAMSHLLRVGSLL